jgi:hypothetical protein
MAKKWGSIDATDFSLDSFGHADLGHGGLGPWGRNSQYGRGVWRGTGVGFAQSGPKAHSLAVGTPINLLTLGLFSFVINAAVLGLTAKFIGGFDIQNFWAAVIGAAVLGLLTGVFHKLVPQISDARAS